MMPRQARILKRMAAGTAGGESRVATAAEYARSVNAIGNVAITDPTLSPLTFTSVWSSDNSTVTHSADTGGDYGQSEGAYLHNVLFTLGNATFLGSSAVPPWTAQLTSLAPSAPRRAYAWDTIANNYGDGQFYTWNSPGVAASALTVAVQNTGLGMWTSDWWSGGPASSFSESGVETYRGLLVYVQSDAGSTVADAGLIYRSIATDVGVVEAWFIEGAQTLATTATVSIDAVALSGDIQWAYWVDIYNVP